MPILSGSILGSPDGGLTNQHLSTDGLVVEGFIYPNAGHEFASDLREMAALSQNGLVSVASRAIVGASLPSYFDDFYDRIYVTPLRIELGNLLSVQTRQLEVWNAFTQPKLLSDIEKVGADGLTLTEPEATPTTFNGLESRIYSLNISTNGPPVIAAELRFVFPSVTPVVSITGRRVTLWPFLPQTIHREALDWLTDIISSFGNEQRLALRKAPRQTLSYEFILDPKQFSRAKAIATQWAHRVYGIGVWSEATFVGEIAAGATTLIFDTTNADFRDNDLVLIWESDKKMVAVENLDVTPAGITLKLPLEVGFSNAFVTPLRFARTYSGMAFRRGARDEAIAKADFSVTSNADLSADVGYDQYRGIDVLLERPVIQDEISERISRSIDMFDNGSGPVAVDIKTDYPLFDQLIGFDLDDRASRWTLRQWLHSRYGRQRSFWLPSWNRDLELIDNITVGSNVITVAPIGYGLYYGIKDIMVLLKDGTRYYNRTLSATTDMNGNEILELLAAFPVGIATGDIDLVCFMSHVRLNSDRVEIAHGYAGRVSVSIPVVETPE